MKMKKFLVSFFLMFVLLSGTCVFAEEVGSDSVVNESVTEGNAGDEGAFAVDAVDNAAGNASESADSSINEASVSYSAEDDFIFKIDLLCVGNDLFNNIDEIADLSSNLSFSEKEAVYEAQSVYRFPYFLCNYMLGCGIGSFIQGDIAGGRKALILDITGGALVFGGVMLMTTDLLNMIVSVFGAVSQTNVGGGISDFQMIAEVVMLSVGSCIMLGSRIYQMIRPWYYGSKRNSTLKEALGLNAKENNIVIAPCVNPLDKSYGIVARISL